MMLPNYHHVQEEQRPRILTQRQIIRQSSLGCGSKNLLHSPSRASAGNCSLQSFISRPTQCCFQENNGDPEATTSSEYSHWNASQLSKKSINKKKIIVNQQILALSLCLNVDSLLLILHSKGKVIFCFHLLIKNEFNL